ncbi:MAG: histidine kinase [Bacteroidetes bacterium]|nr:histidine kinase [Bacteroidota bacterium]
MSALLTVIRKYKLGHLPGWGLLLLGWYYFRYQDYPAGMAWRITLIKVADLAIMVYCTNELLIPKLLYKKRYFLFSVIFFLLVFCFSFGKMYVEELVMGRPHFFDLSTNFKGRVYDNVIPHFLLVITGAAFKLLADYAYAQKRLVEIASEKSEAELQWLKSQINPHLVFNSLNSIYFLIDKQNAEARQTVLMFADLLRYQLYDCNADMVDIGKEVAYLRDYIALQKLRTDKQYEINLEEGPGLEGFRIPPLLLVPFIENAFKHISHHTDRPNFVRMKLCYEQGRLLFMVENSKEEEAADPRLPGGIGLSNVRRRLMLLYAGKHALQIRDNDGKFSVHLNLEIT